MMIDDWWEAPPAIASASLARRELSRYREKARERDAGASKRRPSKMQNPKFSDAKRV